MEEQRSGVYQKGVAAAMAAGASALKEMCLMHVSFRVSSGGVDNACLA